MSVVLLTLLIAVLLLAYVNGANDNFKSVATLFGSGTTTYRVALAWATVTTLAGSLLALVLAHNLAYTFRGQGLVPDAVTREPSFLLAVSLGAALALCLATYLGLPVSTTHALLGGLLGAGALAAGGALHLTGLTKLFLLSLALSPLLAFMITVITYPLARWGGRALGLTRQSCLCLGDGSPETLAQPGGTLALAQSASMVEAGTMAECSQRFGGRMFGLEAGAVLDGCHFLSTGAVGFARGLNDTPKIMALLLAGSALPPQGIIILIAGAMALGGIFNARKVAETMSLRITAMNPGQGFTANMVTSGLVLAASVFGLPVSTTHVSVGALFGLGAATGTARRRTIISIVLAWVTTLPLAALLAAGVYTLGG